MCLEVMHGLKRDAWAWENRKHVDQADEFAAVSKLDEHGGCMNLLHSFLCSFMKPGYLGWSVFVVLSYDCGHGTSLLVLPSWCCRHGRVLLFLSP